MGSRLVLGPWPILDCRLSQSLTYINLGISVVSPPCVWVMTSIKLHYRVGQFPILQKSGIVRWVSAPCGRHDLHKYWTVGWVSACVEAVTYANRGLSCGSVLCFEAMTYINSRLSCGSVLCFGIVTYINRRLLWVSSLFWGRDIHKSWPIGWVNALCESPDPHSGVTVRVSCSPTLAVASKWILAGLKVFPLPP